MENKLKEQLRLRMLGQLSDEKTKLDVDNAYDVAVDFCLSFISFLLENYDTKEVYENYPLEDNIWREYETQKEYTTEELLSKFLEEYDKL